jgi:hypothetical protein
MGDDYYRQKGAPHSDGHVDGAERNDYARPNEEENPLKCYRLDEDNDIVGDRVYINGEGKPTRRSRMMDMQNQIKLIGNTNPGIRPGDLEAIGSYIFAIVISLVLIATIFYYMFGLYKNTASAGGFIAFTRKWALKWPFC